jgi:hypothetical protein
VAKCDERAGQPHAPILRPADDVKNASRTFPVAATEVYYRYMVSTKRRESFLLMGLVGGSFAVGAGALLGFGNQRDWAVGVAVLVLLAAALLLVVVVRRARFVTTLRSTEAVT